MIVIRSNVPEGLRKIAKLKRALSPEAIDSVVDRVALEAYRNLVKATPKKWTGQTRAAWKKTKPAPGVRTVENPSKVMIFLEKGTRAHGPVRAKFLFIPKTRRAAGGWNANLKRGTDYILVKNVRGIQAMKIVEKEQEATQRRYKEAAVEHIRNAIK